MEIDFGQIMKLSQPLDKIIQLFQSFHIPSGSNSNNPDDIQASFQIENTLKLLQSLLSQYDSTLDSLCNARETIRKLENRQVVNNQRITEWSSNTLKMLQNCRNTLVSLHESQNHSRAEMEVLRARLKKTEEARQGSESVVLSLVEKIHAAEEVLTSQKMEIGKLQAKNLTLKTQIEQIIKWKKHMDGTGIMNEFHSRNNSTARQRGIQYSDALKIQELAKRRTDDYAKSLGIHRTESRSSSKSRRAKSKSRTRTKSNSSTTKTDNSSILGTKKKRSPSYSFTNETSEFNIDHEIETVARLLGNDLASRQESLDSKLYPAQSKLLAKLRDVDCEINELARELMLQQ
jgi:hypothetical protein